MTDTLLANSFICWISQDCTWLVRVPKSEDWMKPWMTLLACVRSVLRLSFPTIMRMPQAKQESELVKTSILKVSVSLLDHLQCTSDTRKCPRKAKLLSTNTERYTISIAQMRYPPPPDTSLHRQNRCKHTQQMLEAITQIWLESISRYSLARSDRVMAVCALARQKMRMEAMQYATPMQQYLKFLREMSAKLFYQERLYD